jgi:cell division transport system ATP-binding protein
MIELHRVSKHYPNGYLALDDASIRIGEGEFVFLTGHSGAGKSTLLKIFAAIETVNAGDIIVAKQNLRKMTSRKIPYLRRQIGIIMQTPNLLMDKTVFDNVALPLVISGYAYPEIHSRVRAVLAKVSLSKREHAYPYELSGGEQQRVAIARAIINKPSLLLADEPTGNLDPELAHEIMCLFEQFNQLGMTIVIASHDLDLVKRFGHRQLIIEKGKLIEASVPA